MECTYDPRNARMRAKVRLAMKKLQAVALSLEVLKDALEKRGLNCSIEGRHPFEIPNSIGALLGHHPGYGPHDKPHPFEQR